jgi:hypothetical protein
MKLLQRLPGFERSPPGLERRILKTLPFALVGSLLAPLLAYLAVTLGGNTPVGLTAERHASDMLIAGIAFTVTAWTAILTVAIGCLIVILMKGPAYVADRYPLSDADEPRPAPGDRHEGTGRD